jgi:CubicO group peptidase (beta-lactamase class C family)
MRKFSLLFLIANLIILGSCKSKITFESQGFDSKKIEVFQTFISDEIKSGKIAGAEILIAKNDAIVLHEAQGFANLTTQKPLSKNSIYYLQSMTKPIISLAIMQLVEKGKLFLEDTIEQYIPEATGLQIILDPEQGMQGEKVQLKESITIRHLLSHTAGFSHGLGTNKMEIELYNSLYGPPLQMSENPHNTIESRVRSLLAAPLIGQPGKQWYYSASPDILALIVQRVSKQTIPDYLKSAIFDPLGMNDTGYNVPDAESNRVMSLHFHDQSGQLIPFDEQIPTSGNTLYGGTHGLFSTAQDYLRFCQMILNNGTLNNKQILKPETLRLMTQDQTNGVFEAPGKGFGLGFEVILNPTAEGYENKGQLSWGGYFRTHFFIHPEQNLVAIWMTQMLPYSNEYGDALRENVYGALLVP